MDGRAVGVVEGGQLFYIRTDHIGRPVFATNDLGVKVWETEYLPFGGVFTSTGGIDLRFPGQWYQLESGLHQNWMRDYDPTTGRYIQADPLGLVDGASVYGYALQNPGRYSDPRGEAVWIPYAIAAGYGAATNIAIGYAFDQAFGDGCYSWSDAAFDGGLGALFGFGGYAVTGYRGLTYWASRYKAGKYSPHNKWWPEWSHSVPARVVPNRLVNSSKSLNPLLRGTRNNPSVFHRMNGNHVPRAFHSLTDPRRNLRRQLSSQKTPNPLRSFLRAPGWMTFPVVGGGLSGGLQYAND